ncbi:13114_t:CDS:2, partial [Funneliformis geosporum]
QAEKMPWLVMGFGIDNSGTSGLHGCPHWSVKDPATAAAFRHGSGDIITLLLCLFRSEIREDAVDFAEFRDLVVSFGVPGVKQKSYRFTRAFRTMDKAFDLDDTSHFIGILKKKGLFGGFRVLGNGRVAGWGSSSKRSVLWITNQLQYSHQTDYAGDDPHTINPHNGFSHYLIFTNFTTAQINEKFLNRNQVKTLPQLVARLKGTLVRIGPDTLELMD